MIETPPTLAPQPFSIGVIVLGGGALLLSAVLALGFFLPTDWEASATTRLEATPAEVFQHIDSPEGWRRWTTWPDSGVVREGPERGAGALLRWDDQELGSGTFRIVSAELDRSVSYAVEVNGGAMTTAGAVRIASGGAGAVVVTWEERGDLGRNPLMGFWAFFMDRAQTTELEKGLARLASLAEAPDDSLRSGSSPTR